MENLFRIVVLGILGLVFALVAFNLIRDVLGLLFPLAILGAVGYGIFRLTRPKSISGRKGRYLP